MYSIFDKMNLNPCDASYMLRIVIQKFSRSELRVQRLTLVRSRPERILHANTVCGSHFCYLAVTQPFGDKS